MFSCSACLRRAVLNLAADFPTTSSISPPLLAPFSREWPAPLHQRPHHATSVRSMTTLQSIKKGHHRRTLIAALTAKKLPKPNKRRNLALPTKVERRDRLARENNATHLAVPDYKAKLDRQAAKEAQYLVDPLRLADEVRRNLQNDSFDKALALVRASDTQGLKEGKKRGGVNNVVSWNHLCDWCMAKHDPQTALKTYNEMKKRGHRPDAHTYTIMLRGFAENIRKPNAVRSAMAVYNSMFEPNGLKPNTIHTNAIITVCAKGGNMDELWSVAGRLPEKGPGAADHVTYTAILKAIERDTINQAAEFIGREGKDTDAGHIFDKAVEDGRKLWRDVIIRWRQADLHIDESLVCAMGRLLLLSKKTSDVMDVFRLVEQTMDVRLPKSFPRDEDQKPADSAEGQRALTVFTPVPRAEQVVEDDESTTKKSIYVPPGNNTLSMLMEAAALTKRPDIGKQYWYVLTSDSRQRHVQPDANNITTYLRLLRISRASHMILEVLQHAWPDEIAKTLHRRGVYVIAMSTCVRDKNNPNVFKTASKIVDIMQDKAMAVRDADDEEQVDLEHIAARGQMQDVDPVVMAMYLNLAMYTTKGINRAWPLTRTKEGDLNFERDPSANNTIRALRRMGPDAMNLRRMLKMKMAEMDVPGGGMRRAEYRTDRHHRKRSAQFVDAMKTNESLDDLVGLVRAMVSAYDRILAVNTRLKEDGLGPLDEEIVLEAKLQKAKLSGYLGRIDQSLLDQGRLGKSGVWEGYDPAKVEEEDREDEKKGEEGGGGEIKTDYYLRRTVAGARLKKAIKHEEKREERERRERLSRRQKQEREKGRREERLRNLRAYDVKARTERASAGATRTGRQRGVSSSVVQRGWGGGFADMAQEMGQEESGKLIELGR